MNDKLEQAKLKYDYVMKIRELNQQQAIFKIPKYLILKNVIPYLEDEEIVPFVLTCKTFKTIIFSPIGYEIILASKARAYNFYADVAGSQIYPSYSLNTAEELKRFEGSREDAFAQLETLKSVKEFLTAKVKTLEEVIKSHQKEILKLKASLQNEENLNKKNVGQIYLLENRLRSYEVEKEDHDSRIKELNFKYQKIVLPYFS